ncbi:MAG: molybdopterin-dependent oxidoreductase [Desulfuromonadaceae bacterium]|nr:molybdopterin-dependent oxidoreductase [Desulfuromonadaceae bacterium]
MEIKRRDFLKLTVAAGAVATVGLPKLNAFAAANAPATADAPKGEWIPSTCQGCTAWCPVEFYVQEGRIVKVRGNQLSKANGGYCCPRGHLMIQQTYDPDRIKVPMKRTNPAKGRGIDPKFVPISWDEALDTVAEKMIELRTNKEPEKLVYMRGRYSPTSTELLYGTLPKVYGTPNYFSHSAICAEAEKMGPGYTQGFFGYRDYDLAKSKCLVIWGCDPLSSNRQVPNAISKFGDIFERGSVIVVDPRLSASGAKANEWLPIKPGEDGALASAISHVLLTEGMWSKVFVGDFKDGKNLFVAGKAVDEAAFVEKETHGIVKYWNLELKDKTAAWAAKKCLIPAEQIIRVARTMGKAGSACAVWMGPGAAMQVRGTYAAMSVYALNGILGSVETEGGVFQSSSAPTNKFPDAKKFIDELAEHHGHGKRLDGRGSKDMPAIMGGFDTIKDKDGTIKEEKPKANVVTNYVATGMLKNPDACKVFISTWSNFAFSATGAQRWEKAMAAVPFFVHMVTNASEMTQFADIVLPATFAPTEKLSVITNMANLHGHVSIQQPVAKPLWGVKPEETEVMWLLAEKLKARGFANLYDYYASFEDPETKKKPANAAEFCEIAAKISSSKVWDGKEKQKGDQLAGWADFKKKGIYNTETYKYKKNWGKFKTVTHKFEFYSETLKKTLGLFAAKHKTAIDDILQASEYEARGELAFVPHYESPVRRGSEKEYPFTFIDHKSRLNREGRSQNTAWYHEFKKVDVGDKSWDDVAKINPIDAKKLGLKDGDAVRLTSVSGSITCNIRLWEGVRPGTVAKCYGQGHWAYGRVAAKEYGKKPRGGNNNELMPDNYDRLSGATARNGGFTGVKIEKA